MIQRNTETTTTVRTTLGPADHGRRMTLEDFFQAGDEEGYRYELIEGVVEVTPAPDMPHERVVMHLVSLFERYRSEHPERVNFIACRGRLVQRDPAETCPEPDLCVYRDCPLHQVRLRWEQVQPIVVVEVLSLDSSTKDIDRNRRVYLGFEGIAEYWIIDPLIDPAHPTMLVLRRSGDEWEELSVGSGGTYVTDLLPGLTLDLSRICPPPPERQDP